MIAQIRTFSRTFFRSFTPSYYPHLLRAPLKFSLKYLLFLIFILSFLFSAIITLTLATTNLPDTLSQLANLYPADLTLNLDHGQLTINQPLPYTIDFPPSFFGNNPPVRSSLHLVVFDSDTNVGSPDNIPKYNSLAVITPTTLYLQDSTTPLPTDLNLNLNATAIHQAATQISRHPLITYHLYLLIIFIFLLLTFDFGLFTFSLFSLLLFTPLLFISSRIFPLPYRPTLPRTYQVSIHSLSVIYLALLFLNILGLTIPPALILLTYLAFSLWGISSTINPPPASSHSRKSLPNQPRPHSPLK